MTVCYPKDGTHIYRDEWEEYFNLKKEEWKAIGITASLLTVAAADFLIVNSNGVKATAQVLSIASIACSLGAAISSTILLGSFVNVSSMRVAWFRGGAVFVFTLSAARGWERRGKNCIEVTPGSRTGAVQFLVLGDNVMLSFLSEESYFYTPVRQESRCPAYILIGVSSTHHLTPLPPRNDTSATHSLFCWPSLSPAKPSLPKWDLMRLALRPGANHGHLISWNSGGRSNLVAPKKYVQVIVTLGSCKYGTTG
ncbi:hypothetical protein DFH07DRAFT_942696 [Mycena maculata]|uniref:Uncharacterized protein n=1 Tax=Mycena maculata TaxID=230809 RepID=A0AAD7ING0_9AGAR|nr:hypothetical protein DFH07DRAFT_942696 [Mycena maculata]